MFLHFYVSTVMFNYVNFHSIIWHHGAVLICVDAHLKLEALEQCIPLPRHV